MKCPACQQTLSELRAGDITVDVCRRGCGGVWFDDREIKKFDEESEIRGTAILSVERGANVRIGDDGIRYCPKCQSEELCKRFYDIQNQVQVDQCLKCSGIWLDPGELKTIRGQYATERDRNAAADAYLEGHLQNTKAEVAEGYKARFEKRQDDTSFKGTLRSVVSLLLVDK